MSQAFEQEKDLQNLLRMTTTLGNLCFNNEEVFEFVGGLGITFPDVNKLQGADQPDAAKAKQSIKEIRAMLKL